MTATWDRLLPTIEDESRPFWEGAARGELMIQHCPACRRHQFYPRQLCTACAGPVDWVQVSGRGHVYTYTIVRQNRMPPFEAMLPYVVAMIELDEGPRMLTNITDVAPEDVYIGMPVSFYAVEAEPGTGIPFWRPAPPE